MLQSEIHHPLSMGETCLGLTRTMPGESPESLHQRLLNNVVGGRFSFAFMLRV